jgi:F0F1-type ATP synthase membrane subunit b/b'
MASRNGQWFGGEMEKLNGWAEDRRTAFKAELLDIEEQLNEGRRAARLAGTLPEKLEKQRAVRVLETKRDDADREYEQAKREIDRQKDALLDEISRRMEQQTMEERLFSVQWRLI